MNNYEQIKQLLSASRKMLSNDLISEQTKDIKKNYGILLEQGNLGVGNQVTKRDDVPQSVERNIQFTISPEKEKKQSYRVSGGLITLYGKSKKDLELTTDEKAAFQETMDEFVAEVSDLTDFGKLNVFINNVEWSGHIVDMDVDFFFSINETDGLYIKGDMIKIDKNFIELTSNLQSFYQKFKTKWAKILASRKKTKTD